jgi:hypothetical protein
MYYLGLSSGLALVRHAPSFSYFSGRVSICPGPATDHNPPTNPHCTAEITDVHHHTLQISLFKDLILSLVISTLSLNNIYSQFHDILPSAFGKRYIIFF